MHFFWKSVFRFVHQSYLHCNANNDRKVTIFLYLDDKSWGQSREANELCVKRTARIIFMIIVIRPNRVLTGFVACVLFANHFMRSCCASLCELWGRRGYNKRKPKKAFFCVCLGHTRSLTRRQAVTLEKDIRSSEVSSNGAIWGNMFFCDEFFASNKFFTKNRAVVAPEFSQERCARLYQRETGMTLLSTLNPFRSEKCLLWRKIAQFACEWMSRGNCPQLQAMKNNL